MTNRIINTLHTSEKPLDVVDLAILLNEDADDVGAALLELKHARRVHENHRHRFRLTNEERTRLRERQDQPADPQNVLPDPNQSPCSGCVESKTCEEWPNSEACAAKRVEQTSAAMAATDQTVARRTGEDPAVATLTAERSGLEPATRDTEVSAAGSGIVDSCSRCAIYDWPSDDRSQQAIDDAIAAWHESTAEVGLPRWMGWSCEEYERWIKSALEPTDAELDALEAEDDSEEIPGECPDLAVLRAEHATRATADHEKPDVTAGDEEPTCGDCTHLRPHQRPMPTNAWRRCKARNDVDRPPSNPVSTAGSFRREPCEFFEYGPNTNQVLGTAIPTEHVWGVAHNRPTNGLRIEAVARELVEVERRRQKLLEELRRLV